MKRVSFEIAKALKEAGYPQYEHCEEYYDSDGYEVSKYCDIDKLVYPCPTCLEVWLWLWREKKMAISVVFNGYSWESSENSDDGNDPEEAIAEAIEYLVENNLIK